MSPVCVCAYVWICRLAVVAMFVLYISFYVIFMCVCVCVRALHTVGFVQQSFISLRGTLLLSLDGRFRTAERATSLITKHSLILQSQFCYFRVKLFIATTKLSKP